MELPGFARTASDSHLRFVVTTLLCDRCCMGLNVNRPCGMNLSAGLRVAFLSEMYALHMRDLL